MFLRILGAGLEIIFQIAKRMTLKDLKLTLQRNFHTQFLHIFRYKDKSP